MSLCITLPPSHSHPHTSTLSHSHSHSPTPTLTPSHIHSPNLSLSYRFTLSSPELLTSHPLTHSLPHPLLTSSLTHSSSSLPHPPLTPSPTLHHTLSPPQTPAQQTGKLDFNKRPELISPGGGFGPVRICMGCNVTRQ